MLSVYTTNGVYFLFLNLVPFCLLSVFYSLNIDHTVDITFHLCTADSADSTLYPRAADSSDNTFHNGIAYRGDGTPHIRTAYRAYRDFSAGCSVSIVSNPSCGWLPALLVLEPG